MKNTKKRIILGLTAIITLSNSNIYSYAMEEEPIENQGQEIVEDVPYDTGWIQGTDGKYYYIDESGSTVTGWKEIEGKEYYFDETGAWIEETQVEEVTEEQPVQEQEYLNVNQWIKDNNGWWYRHEDGSYTTKDFEVIDGKTYYFNASGYMVTGWNYIENNWYYFDGSGAMRTDWLLLGNTWYYMEPDGKMVTGRQTIREKEYYFDTSGAMKTGWIKLEGKDYYYNPDGALMKDTWIGDYYVDETGAWIPNKFKPKWIKDNTGWWYRHEDGGYTKNDFEKIGNVTYYFDKNGYMVTNWKQVEDNWYYFDGSGAMKTDWLLLGNTWYYMEPDGKMVTGWHDINGSTYYFSPQSGSLAIDQFIEGKYVDEDGRYIEGKLPKPKWFKDNNGWWYRHEDGSRTKNDFEKIGNATYYFDKNGYMVTNWKSIKGNWYFFGDDGAMKTGWILSGKTWYYLDNSGVMQIGWQLINNNWYYLNTSGAMTTGWQKIEGKWYYLNSSGEMQTGWKNLSGTWYYLNNDGTMQIGWLQLNNEWYYLSGSGAMVTGWQYIGNIHYYFDSSGVMRKENDGPSYINGIMIVNKKYPLSSSYAPGENYTAGVQVRKLIRDMQSLGYRISSTYSGYRSYSYQNQLYWSYVNIHGQAQADTFSARPGYSEHQTGLAFDIIHSNGSLVETAPEVNWIAQNAHKYGFIVRYQAGKEHITGYQAEPWHLRYVGDIAYDIYRSELTLEEYLGVAGGGY